MKERVFQGKPVSPGYAEGGAVVFGTDQTEASRRSISPEEIDKELARFRQALESSRSELLQLSDRVRSELGVAEADIFAAHLVMLQDQGLAKKVTDAIRLDRVNAEAAIASAIAELAQLLGSLDDEYLRQREADIRDLGRRVLRHLSVSDDSNRRELGSTSVLVARELLPSDLLEIDRGQLAGIVTELGGEAGHAAILARAFGVPAVTGVKDVTKHARTGMRVLLDGQTGEVILEPSAQHRAGFGAQRAEFDRVARSAEASERLPCRTRDGVSISLYANIGREDDVAELARHHIDGVGLFRTEYLFLDQPKAPSFERQRRLYGRVAAALAGLPLTVRTLDLGGDKFPAFLSHRFEANPNLGIRGLRFSLLSTQELFRVQLKAILHVSKDFDVRILLPMVIGGSDMRTALAVIHEVADQERVEQLPPVGALIETPAAVFAIEEILAQSDFVGVGTNDLTQFILAADRNALATMNDYTVLHPSVLRAIRWVVKAADAAGKPVSVCGEAAADPSIAGLLVGLGIRQLSMSPVSASRVRLALRGATCQTLQRTAEAALASDSAAAVAALLGRRADAPL
jgi:phosphoenolpyruvate-protein phosphotransferase